MPAVEVELPNRRATRRLGRALASVLAPGDVVWLEGELGAGKTFLARAILRGLGVPTAIPVTSPTFALAHEHEGRVPIRHLDLYRLIDPDDLIELGLDEGMDERVTIVEWGARFRAAIGARGLEIALAVDGERRIARITALDARGAAIALAVPKAL